MNLNEKANEKVQPVYEVIKREDLIGAFKDAIIQAFQEVMAQIKAMIDLYSATAPSSLWVWGQTSRWDYDLWW